MHRHGLHRRASLSPPAHVQALGASAPVLQGCVLWFMGAFSPWLAAWSAFS